MSSPLARYQTVHFLVYLCNSLCLTMMGIHTFSWTQIDKLTFCFRTFVDFIRCKLCIGQYQDVNKYIYDSDQKVVIFFFLLFQVLEQSEGLWKGCVITDGRTAKAGYFPPDHVVLIDKSGKFNSQIFYNLDHLVLGYFYFESGVLI